MGALTRQYDWAQTSLGTPDQWPQSLRTTLSIILNSRFPMFLFWGPEHLCFYNDAYRPSLGEDGKHPSALGRPGQQVWPDIWPVIKPLIDQVMSGGEPTYDQYRLLPILRNNNLEDVYWTASYSPVVDEQGLINGVFATCFENTKAVLHKQQLEASERQLRLIVEESAVAMVILRGPQHIIELANEAHLTLWGRRAEEVIGEPLFDALPEARGQGYEALLDNVLRTGEPFHANELSALLMRRGQLEPVHFNIVYHPLRTVEGLVDGILVTAVEITQQVMARQKIEESETRFRTLAEGSPILIAVGDQTGNATYFNKAWGELTGRPLEDLIAFGWVNLIHPGDKERYITSYRDAFTARKPFTGECRVLDASGNYRWLLTQGTARFNEGGAFLGYITACTDITQRKQSQLWLQEQQAILHGAIELAGLGTWRMDVVSGEMNYSERLQSWLGVEDAVLGREASPRVHPSDRERVGQAIANALEKGGSGRYDEEYTITHAQTGQERIIHAIGQTTFDEEGNPRTLAGTAQDVTLERRIQLALKQQVQQRTEELAAINEELTDANKEYADLNEELQEANGLLRRSNDNLQTFAYIASHDLQEPLRKIQQFGDLLKTRYTESAGEELVYVERMQTAAARMSTLIRDLLSYSRISTHQDNNTPVSLQQIVATVLNTLELTIQKTGAQIQVESLPTLSGDASQLGQLFQNLISNALKFRRPNTVPLIEVRAQLVAATDLPTSVKPSRVALQYYRIEVADNGVGFDTKYLNRIFQVFQRLHGKNEFAGTGIGLAICEKVVTNHGGAITATSQPGQGATFIIYLPS